MVRDQLTGIAQQVESKTRHMCKGDRSLRTAEGLFPATRQMAVAIHMDSLNVAPRGQNLRVSHYFSGCDGIRAPSESGEQLRLVMYHRLIKR